MEPDRGQGRRIGTIIKLLPKIGAVGDLTAHVPATETRRLHMASDAPSAKPKGTGLTHSGETGAEPAKDSPLIVML
ncbi:hypothetical protein [Nocardiopsis sp. RV163]|uniref:hypothetical protein n=1 Tax=Nocardiopsis sp. RV163 TaxID=1661388 RepID=UPI000AF713D6|nr:hypothetical protein [Nocardiopsis sp. RV163]